MACHGRAHEDPIPCRGGTKRRNHTNKIKKVIMSDGSDKNLKKECGDTNSPETTGAGQLLPLCSPALSNALSNTDSSGGTRTPTISPDDLTPFLGETGAMFTNALFSMKEKFGDREKDAREIAVRVLFPKRVLRVRERALYSIAVRAYVSGNQTEGCNRDSCV